MQLYFDGWYMIKGDAEACLLQCERLGAVAVGVVESAHKTWGLIYWCEKELFQNHTIDARNAAAAVLDKRP